MMRGPELGHYQTASSIAAALGGRELGQRCELIHSREMLKRDVQLLTRECDAHVRNIETYFGAQGPATIRVYLFNGPDQKGWLMGAANTYIAKPWRKEIYLQAAGFPHPVMAHELAHVLAGSFGRGPFKIAGAWGGWLPDPGRIEGIAVAAAPSDEADLSSSEWAKAMLDLQLLPSFDQVFGLGFLAQHSSTAYTVAGAFLQYLRDQQGPEAIRAWYGGQSLDSITKASLAEWEQRFRAYLGTLSLSEAALNNARIRFDQPGVFGRRCPHDVDRWAQQGNASLAGWDIAGARDAFAHVLELDPHHLGARLELGACTLRSEGTEPTGQYYQQLALEPSLHPRERAAVLLRWADLELLRGNAEIAEHLFDEVAQSTVDEDELRQLDVKRYAARALAAGNKTAHAAIASLLLGDPALGQDWGVASAKLASWSETEPTQGLADYLLGKNLFGNGRWDEAAFRLDRALQRQLDLPRVAAEALRTRLILACAQQQVPRVAELFAESQRLAGVPMARREGTARLAARCGVDVSALTSGGHPSAGSADSELDSAPANPAKVAKSANEAAAVCPDGMQRIPGGEFWMGTTGKEGTNDDRPRFKTQVADFCIDETEVTMQAYRACVDAGKCSVPHGQQITCNFHHPERGNHPINCVDYEQAMTYCSAQQRRLPSEVEWEYAAKGGGEERKFSWGNEAPEGHTCWNRGGSCPVKSYPAGAFGLFDMTGNVWEWTSDYFGPYPWPSKDPTWKIYRGGSWSRRFEKWMVNTLRNRFTPREWGSHLGLRCATLAPGAVCPFGTTADGGCAQGVLDMQCPAGSSFNGLRCAAPGEPRCLAPTEEEAGFGCVDPTPKVIVHHDQQALRDSVRRSRSAEFDADCEHYQPKRPHAYRFEGGTSPVRNEVVSSQGCKNRDVSASWNSACCP
jgi:formylglycine-generating enzyme required for sulfatase activity